MDWPFRICGEYIEWYNQRLRRWVVPIGASDSLGYRMLSWRLPDGSRRYLRAHSVCWITHHGPLPPGREIDHIDGNKANNRISNLRLVTHRENMIYAHERLGNWIDYKALHRLSPHQEELLLAIPPGWNVLHQLGKRWNISKFVLGNMRSTAKKRHDPRFLAGL